MSDDEEWSLHIAKLMIAAKIQNYRNILRRYIRDYGECREVEDAARILDANKRYALGAEDKTQLMGFEEMNILKFFPNSFSTKRNLFHLAEETGVRQRMLSMPCYPWHIH